jgi:hypothetical protein
MDKSIESLIIQLSNLKLTDKEEDKDINNLINKLSSLNLNDDDEIDELIDKMSNMKITEEIKVVIVHVINQCRLQYALNKNFMPLWTEAF